MTRVIQVITTVDSRAAADSIARQLLQAKVCACVQVGGPVSSSYWWEDSIQTAEEWICVAKTTAANYDAVERKIKSIHPYSEPEILAVPVVSGSQSYMNWIDLVTTSASAD